MYEIAQIRELDFTTVFREPWDTKWWFGVKYNEEYGQEWPYEGAIPPAGYRYPVLKDALLVVTAMGIFLTFVRLLFDRCVAAPLAVYLGMKPCSTIVQSPSNPGLEALFKRFNYNTPSTQALSATCLKLGIELRDGERWMRKRRNQLLFSRHSKFTESLWKFVLYGSLFIYGFCITVTEDYFWDTKLCWIGYPNKIWAIKETMYWYYMIELGYYGSCLVYQFFDVKRKDFIQMFIHHVCTVMLIGLSYTASQLRIGSLIMLLHDFSDVSLEATKMSKYTHRPGLANVFFTVFGVSFGVSRIIVFPIKLIYSTLIESEGVVFGYPIFINGMFLCVLYLLHIFWFSLIIRIIIQSTMVGAVVEHDLRSEDEAVSSTSEETHKDK